jgi:hypothetical protein
VVGIRESAVRPQALRCQPASAPLSANRGFTGQRMQSMRETATATHIGETGYTCTGNLVGAATGMKPRSQLGKIVRADSANEGEPNEQVSDLTDVDDPPRTYPDAP